ncbi:MAG: sigma-54 dependent transcriptional regulator [Cyclobacteriaceae bacterium]
MKKPGKILIVDDDNYILLSIRILLEQYYSDVYTINNPGQIASAFDENTFDVVILDMNFRVGDTSGKEGLHWFKKINQRSAATRVIFLTAYGAIETAVEAVKKGAFNFLTKPWENEKLLEVVAEAMASRQNPLNNNPERISESDVKQASPKIIGQSDKMQEVEAIIGKVAPTEANVLITGENGTGKELAAKSLHKNSGRNKEIFLSVDLGSVVESLFESEMFGHRKGAFTDALADRVGKMEAANGGTIFLDEIGNLSLPLQGKLLKVLQEREICRVGDNKPIPIDVRLICATNQNLIQMVRNGRFREDLLYRINTVTLQLPSLRERMGDIPLLAAHYLNVYKTKYHKKGLFVPEYVFKKLEKHSWPGNVRELQHAIERAVIMSDGKQLHVRDFALDASYATEEQSGTEEFNLDSIEKRAISQAIQKHRGNISSAAKELGLSRGALYRRMEKYEL